MVHWSKLAFAERTPPSFLHQIQQPTSTKQIPSDWSIAEELNSPSSILKNRGLMTLFGYNAPCSLPCMCFILKDINSAQIASSLCSGGFLAPTILILHYNCRRFCSFWLLLAILDTVLDMKTVPAANLFLLVLSLASVLHFMLLKALTQLSPYIPILDYSHLQVIIF